jgi:D-alanine-D-alanine ligase
LADLVGRTLASLGYAPVSLAAGLDLASLTAQLRRVDPLFVFNLVDDLTADGRLIDFVPGLLDALGLSYTGCSRTATALTSNKLIAKRMLQGAGIDTPPWYDPDADPGRTGRLARPFIVKSVWEHASVGLSQDSVVTTVEALEARLLRVRREIGGEWFAEAFVDGREFNVGMLGPARAPVVLPIAEIEFRGYGPEHTRIVDYAAKWDDASFAYSNTVRTHDIAGEDTLLSERLTTIARSCWDLFDLSGYARVDFRVDCDGRPWVLEVNANPCLDADAGFVAAAARAGLSYADVIAQIVEAREPASAPSRRPGSLAAPSTEPPAAPTPARERAGRV